MCVGQKMASDPLELELTGFCELPDLGAGNRTQLLEQQQVTLTPSVLPTLEATFNLSRIITEYF